MKRSLNERFTDLADTVSEGMGKWWVSVIAAVMVIAWTLYCVITQGAGFWYGTFYNLPLNLVTTLAELWIGFLLAAAANRVERRNREVQRQHSDLLRRLDALSAQDKQTTERDLQTDTRAERRILAVQAQLDRIEEKLDVRQSRAKGKTA